MKYFNLDIYSHYFTISHLVDKAYEMVIQLNDYCTQRGYIGMGKNATFGVVRVFNSVVLNGKEYHYHISLLDKLKQLIISFNFINCYNLTKHDLVPPTIIHAPIREGWVARDYQEPIIDYILEEGAIKLISVATGKGKSSIALMAISKLKMKTLILIKATFLDKWVGDIQNVLDVSPERINVIQGSDALQKLIYMNSEGIDESDFIVMSVSTYYNYIQLYEKFGGDILELGYSMRPSDFLPGCGIGVVLMDEVHMLYGQQFTAMLYMHTHKLIGLSATFFTKDRELETMYRMGFPINLRYKETLNEKYIYVTAISYRFRKPEKIRYTEYGSNMYSQTAFEKCIMRHVPTRERYIEMICDQVNKAYISRYQPGDKCLVFAGTIKMCEFIRDKLRTLYPERSCEKYTAEDPYENAILPDIRVSTIGSLGVGIDIPGLTTCIMSVSIDSIQSSRQSIGRLRKIPNRDVYFYYLYSEDIDKHVRVHHGKRKTLGHIAISFAERYYNKNI